MQGISLTLFSTYTKIYIKAGLKKVFNYIKLSNSYSNFNTYLFFNYDTNKQTKKAKQKVNTSIFHN